MAPHKLRRPPQAPPLFTHTPDTLKKDMQRMIDDDKALEDNIVSGVQPDKADFHRVLAPKAHLEDKLGLKDRILGFYQAVSTDSALRDASTEADKQWAEYAIESYMREDAFNLVDQVFKKQKDDQSLDTESRKYIEKTHKGYVNMGLGIPAGPQRDRFKEIKKRLSDLSIMFQKNLNEEKGGLWFTAEELDGVPEDVVDNLKRGETGTEHEGKIWMTFKYPDLFPALRYCTNAETRQTLFVANENKCNQNTELFKESIVLRDEAARLLGYSNHAALRIEDKMMKSPKTVDEFLGDLRSKLTAGGKSDIEGLKKLKKAEAGEAEHFFAWDTRFYNRLMLERDYQLDQQQIAEYFPLLHAVEGMLNIFEELFGLVFVRIEGEDRAAISETGRGQDIVWHDDVHLFAVWDDEGEGSEFVGYLYLDLHPREGKYGHAANFGIQPGFITKNGTRHYPATALVCNFSKPTPKKPSLLKHEEVVTLFHELGHGIHDLVAKTTYSRFHGTSVVRDFVEAPSQMLENWCWTPSQLKSLSRHYSYLSDDYSKSWQENAKNGKSQPPEQIPDELLDNLIRTKHVNDAMAELRQLHFGIYDMTVHEPASHKAIEDLDPTETFNRLRKEIALIDGPEALGEGYHWGHGEATFGHLIGGYDAGYYGYLSSQVYSMDMYYSVFKKDPMNKKEGRRYRHMVLEKGGSQDEMKTLEDFLGRKPNPEAFYKELGIA